MNLTQSDKGRSDTEFEVQVGQDVILPDPMIFCLVIPCLLFLRFLSTISTNFLKSAYEQAACLPLKM